MHPRHPGDAYSDRQLTSNFELWAKKICVQTCFDMRISKFCLSVLPFTHPLIIEIADATHLY